MTKQKKSGSGEDKISPKERFIRSMISGLEASENLFYERRGELYIDTAIWKGRDLLKLHSSQFNQFMLAMAHHCDNLLLRPADAELIAQHVSSYAEAAARPLSTDPRACFYEGALWINPAWKNSKIIRIADGKWEIIDAPARIFAPLPSTMAMPIPDVTPAHKFPELIKKGIVDFQTYHCFFCTMLAAMFMPQKDVFPIIVITGEGAKGKTTTMKLAIQLVDPEMGNECLIIGDDQRNILVTAQYRKVIGLDNTSRLPISDDLLSQLYAGGSLNERKLYSNKERSQTLVERMRIIINGVAPQFSKPDFFTKTLFLEQPPVTQKDENNQDQFVALSNVEKRWQEMLPQVLGSALSVIAEGLLSYESWLKQLLQKNEPPQAPVRFVEFANMGEFFAQAMGYEKNVLTSQIRALDKNSKNASLISNECAQLVVEWANGARGVPPEKKSDDDTFNPYTNFPKAKQYEISTRELHRELKSLASSKGDNIYKMNWLRTDVTLGMELQNALQAINHSEWSMWRPKKHGSRWIIELKSMQSMEQLPF